MTLRVCMLSLSKEPSLGPSTGGAISSREKRVTVEAWSKKKNKRGEGGERSGGRVRAGFVRFQLLL